MAFCGGRLRVALLSWHVPLREVSGTRSVTTLFGTTRARFPVDVVTVLPSGSS